ncbi:MAG: protein kinase [Vicinamibacterales bacterium]
MEPQAGPLPGSIGRFTIEERLGAGGMGEVYKGFDPTLRRHVAIKTVRADMEGQEFVDRFYREAQACARLQHPNIVTVYEVGEYEGGAFIAMEYLRGTNLATAIDDDSLGLREKLSILVQILDALEHAHGELVVHRDIKPRNVHLLPGGTAKLLDFGLARVATADTITMTGSVMGTPHYASPEQLRAERVDARSDLFSTGVLAYELLEGRRPFDGESISAVLIKVLSEPPAPAHGAWRETFPELEQLVQRAIAKSPDDRFQSAPEMRAAVTAVLDGRRADLAAFDAGARRPTPASGGADAATLATAPARGTAPTVTRLPRAVDATTVPEPHQPPAGRTPVAAIVAAVSVVALGAGVYWQTRPAPDVAATAATSPASSITDAQRPVTTTSASSGEAVPPVPAATPVASGVVPPASPAAALRTPSAATTVHEPAPAPAAPAAADSPSTPAGAKAAFSAADAKNVGLRWRLIQKLESGEEVEVDPARTFRSGDRVRLAFESNSDGFLYIAMQGSSRRWAVVFPSEQINGGSNAVTAGSPYQMPDNGWFRFDETPGTEELFVVFSRQRLAEMPGFTRGARRGDSVPAKAVEDMRQRLASRDLVFEKDSSQRGPKGTASQVQYVVNRDELAAAVAVTISLVHAQ